MDLSQQRDTAKDRQLADAGCKQCTGELTPVYFMVNGKPVCEPCKRAGDGSLLLALALGSGAGLLSSALYYFILHLTGWRFVLVAVLAGVVIGLSVRRAARWTQGTAYRWLALVLTYLTVVSTYTHKLVEAESVSMLQALLTSPILPLAMLTEGKNLVTLILLGFGLHEAWQFTRPPRVHLEGPFELSSQND